MKLKNLLFACLILSGLFIASCSKDEDNTQKFTTSSVEQNKATIQDNGFAFLGEIKSLESSASVQNSINAIYTISRGSLLENNPAFQPTKKVSLVKEILKPLEISAKLQNFNAKQTLNDLMNDVPNTIADEWNDLIGVYSWNYKTGEWDFSKTGSEILINYPAYYNDTLNYASFRVYGFKSVEGTYDWTEATVMPTAIKAELKVFSNVYLTFAFSAAYNNTDGKPSSVSVNLNLKSYSFALSATNKSNSNGSGSFSFKNGSTTLMALSIGATGSWSEDNLADSEEIGDVLSTANASFQIMNIKVAGKVDYAKLEADMIALEESPLSDDSLNIAAQCDIINKYANLSVCYVDNNTIIAKVIAFPQVYTYSQWNEGTQQYDIIKEYEIGVVFKFADDSTIDAYTYFNQGFQNLAWQAYSYYRYLNETYGYDK